MPDISGQLIKDSYSYILQADTSTGYVYRVNGNVPVNPIFSSGLTVFSAFTFVDGSQQNGYVLTSDGSGNARWASVSGASVSSVTTSTGLSGNSTTGAITLINTAPDQTVVITGGTNIEIVSNYPNFGINFTGQTSFPYLPLSGGTVTGNTIFQSGLTANTISATTYSNLPNTLYTGDGTLSGNRVVNIGTNTLNFSSSTNPNTLVLSGGSVGVGKLPTYKLDVNGDINFPTTTGSTYGVIRQNGSPILHTYGTGNLFLGVSSGNFTTSGNNNVGVGINTLQSNTIGYSNSAFGRGSLSNNTTGFGNVGVGSGSLRENTIGNTNVAIGASALQNNLIGSSNVAIGNSAGLNETGSNKLYIANTDTKTLIYGEFDNNRVGINTTSLSNAFTVSASTDPVKLIGLQSASDTNVLTVDATGVVHITPISGLTNIYNSNGTLTGNRVVNLSSYTLNFSSSTNPNTLVLSGGNVGIGTATPSQKLDVSGNTNFTLGTGGFIKLVDTTGGYPTHLQASYGNGFISNNSIFNVSDTIWKYSSNGAATMLQMEPTLGQFIFYTANAGSSGDNVPFVETIRLVSGNTGINVSSPTNKLHVSDSTDPVKLEGVQTSSDTDLLTIDGSGVVHKISTSSVSAFLRNETNSGATDTIQINQSIFNPSDLTVLSTSVFIVDTDADYYILGDLYNYGSIIVNGTLKIGGVLYNYGTITGSGIIE